MALTTEQKATLKANILATPEANTLYTDGNLQGLADYYNVASSPAFWIWKNLLGKSEITGSASVTGTVWNWSAYIARTQGERDGWREMFNGTDTINPSLANVRQGLQDIFSGNTNSAPAQRTHLLASARRQATRLEKLFAAGTGSEGDPATGTVYGALFYTELIGL